jgi:acyl-CoA synthetase (NDP forming)
MSDKGTAIIEAFKALGSNDAQVLDAVLVVGTRVTEKAGQFFYNDAGEHPVPLDNITAFKAAMQKEKPHLLPRAFESSLADRAFIDGNLSARAELRAQVGELEATKIAKQYGLSGLGDTKRARAALTDEAKRAGGANNPWSDHPNNTVEVNGRLRFSANALTRQSALVRANPQGAAGVDH